MRKPGGLFGNSGSGIPVEDLKQLETFFYKLSFFLHILDYTGAYLSIVNLTNSNLHALSAAYISYVSYFALVEIFSLPSFYYSKVTNLDLRNSYLQFVYFVPLDSELNCYLFCGVHAATIGTLTDLGFLWFREFYLESSRVIQVEHFCIPL